MGSIAISGYGQVNLAEIQILDGTDPADSGPFNIVDASGNKEVTGTGDYIVTG